MKRLIALTLLITFIFSQELPTPNYQLASKFSQSKVNKMVFSTSVDPHWLKKSNRFWYSYRTGEGTFYYLVDANSGRKSFLFDNAKMAMDITRFTKDPYDAKHLPIRSFRFNDAETAIEFDVTSNIMEDVKEEMKDDKKDEEKDKKKKSKKPKKEKKNFHFSYNIKTKKLSWVEDKKKEKSKPRWANFSPDGQTIIFAKQHNLYMMDRANYEKALEDDKDSTIVEIQLTHDGIENYAFGQGNRSKDNVMVEKEKDDRKSAFVIWAPNSKKFIISRSDDREVSDLWVINSLANPRPTLETYKYVMPGESNYYKSEYLLFDITKDTANNRTKLDLDFYVDQYTSISRRPSLAKDRDNKIRSSQWLSKSNDQVYFSRQSRDMKKLDVGYLDLKTMKTTILIRDSLNTYVEQRQVGLVNEGKEYVHWSERDGWAHLYLYDSKGKLKNQITSGAWHVNSILGIDSKNRKVYFTANGFDKKEDPYYEHVFSANLNGGGVKMLNKGNFNTSVRMNDSRSHFVSNYSSVDSAPKSALYNSSGKKILDLEETNLDRLMESGYQFPEPFKVKSDDGVTDIYGVMYKPFDFDPEKKYPIIEYVYPGPFTEAVNKSFSARMGRTDRVAQLGFIVITVGNRGGHSLRSKWYHNHGYGDLRDYGLADKKAAVEQLADRHDFIDESRVGIFGHSGGGFMSTAAMVVYPDFFKAAVSSAGNHDNAVYNNWWSEKHHGVEEVKDGKGNSTFKYAVDKNADIAKYLKGRLLLATGDMDNNVHPAGTIRMTDALMKANKRFEFVLIPGKRHGFGSYSEYFFWKLADHFTKYLLESDIPPAVDIMEMNREKANKR